MSDRLCKRCRWYHRTRGQHENQAICLQPDTRPTFVDSEPVFPLAIVRRQQWAQRVSDCGAQGYQWERKIPWPVRKWGQFSAWSRPHRRHLASWYSEKISRLADRIDRWLTEREERREDRINQRREQADTGRQRVHLRVPADWPRQWVAPEVIAAEQRLAREGNRNQGDGQAPVPGPPGGHD